MIMKSSFKSVRSIISKGKNKGQNQHEYEFDNFSCQIN